MNTIISNRRAKAFANGNVVLLAYNLGITDATAPASSKIPGCLGFAITRIDVLTGQETILQSKVPFMGTTNPTWADIPTTVAPIQKPVWKDFSAPRNRRLKYRFTPMSGTPGNLVPLNSLAIETNEVICTGALDEDITVEFNNGFLSTQWMKRLAPKLPDGNVDFATLLKWLGDPTNAVAIQQGGYLLDLLMSAIKQARAEGGHVHLALYELSHPALLDLIILNKDVVSIILSNTGTDDATNKDGRARLHAAGVDITDRFVASDEIGHNKFVIYSDKTGNTVYIIAGSTNWTITGVTCQNNVGIKATSAQLSQLFLGEWNLLKSDSALKPVQGVTLRQRNAVQPPICVLKNSGARVQVFFAPNTKEKSKPKTPHPLPVDRAYGDRFMREAEESLLGAFFIPGSPSYLDAFRWLLANKKLAVLKVSVSAIMALMKGDTLLSHKPGERPVAVVANALEKSVGDEIAEFEKLPDGHAIIHLKVWVKDALHKNRWQILVSIASHNGGDKASYQNDENTLYVWGHRSLAVATMVALFDIWDHYWFRTQIDFNMKGDVFQGYLAPDDSWMDKYTVSDAPTLRELVYLTQDVQEEDGPIPDYLQEDTDPDAIQKWIAGTYVNPHQVVPLAQTDWVLPTSDQAADGKTPVTPDAPVKPDAPVTPDKTGKPETGRKPHEAEVDKPETTTATTGESTKATVATEKKMHPAVRFICKLASAIFSGR